MKKTLVICTALLAVGCSDPKPTPIPVEQVTLETQCDYNDETCWQRWAQLQWQQEQGSESPNLTASQEKYIWEWLKQHYPDQDFNNTLNP